MSSYFPNSFKYVIICRRTKQMTATNRKYRTTRGGLISLYGDRIISEYGFDVVLNRDEDIKNVLHSKRKYNWWKRLLIKLTNKYFKI